MGVITCLSYIILIMAEEEEVKTLLLVLIGVLSGVTLCILLLMLALSFAIARLRSRLSARDINPADEDLNEISASVSPQPVLVGDDTDHEHEHEDTTIKEEAASVKAGGNLSSSNDFTWEPLPGGRLAGASIENLR